MKTVGLKYGEIVKEYDVIEGTNGDKGVNISSLLSDTGLTTLDIGYKNTGATESKITFLDGAKGILRYRGYSIEDLVQKSNFIEVSYLLIFGELPSKSKYEKFYNDIINHTMIHEDMKRFYEAFPSNAHPMSIVSSLINSLSSFYPKSQEEERSQEDLYLMVCRLLAKIITISAWSYKNSIGHPVIYPNNKLNYTENFLHMMFATPTDDYEVDKIVSKTLDQLFVIHADHEQNCSTSAVRLVGSSKANLYSSISAGISALWGPLHGGANQKVIEMLEMILKDGGNLDKWVKKAKDKKDSFRLMGFGHRVYKNFDPRAKIIKQKCDEVLGKLGQKNELLSLAKSLEEVALKDEYFIERKLYPNVDFYSGIIYKAINIPVNMFTVMFSIGRLPGWIAHWKEMRERNEPICRPRQIYNGNDIKKYKNILDR